MPVPANLMEFHFKRFFSPKTAFMTFVVCRSQQNEKKCERDEEKKKTIYKRSHIQTQKTYEGTMNAYKLFY